jgi:hypothetical protein
LRIRLPDRTITAEIAAKSLRKAQTAIREAGADNIVCLCCRAASSPVTSSPRLISPHNRRSPRKRHDLTSAKATMGPCRCGLSLPEIPRKELVMKVVQEEVSRAVTVGRAVAAQSDDAEAVEATVSLAKRAGVDAVKFLRRVVVTEGWSSVPQRVRSAHAILEVGHFLGGYAAAETGSASAFREQEAADGGGDEAPAAS